MTSSDDDRGHDDLEGGFGAFFDEPEDFRPPAKPPTFSEHRMRSGLSLKIRTVGSHPLYGHLVWNAGRVSAEYLEDRAREWIHGKDVLELGAGAGLPSLVCALSGARTVVVTDYPDPELVQNLQINADAVKDALLVARQNTSGSGGGNAADSPLRVAGYRWGNPPDEILSYLPDEDPSRRGFDVLILADVIYNHPQHASLLSSVKMTLKRSPEAVAFVVFTPYQPWLLDKIVAFFPMAEQQGFVVTKLFERVLDKLLFEDDPGDETLRRTVFGYELRWKEEELNSW
ncbi:hypothetical protein VTO42DRAFT_7206 [Malbranchea cinnamomea]